MQILDDFFAKKGEAGIGTPWKHGEGDEEKQIQPAMAGWMGI